MAEWLFVGTTPEEAMRLLDGIERVLYPLFLIVLAVGVLGIFKGV